MYKSISKFLILVSLMTLLKSAPVIPPRKIYHLDKLIRVHPKTMDQVLALERLQDNLPAEVDFWKRPNINADVDIHVPIKVYDDVTQRLSHVDLKPTLLVHDIQSVMDQEEASMEIPDYVIDSTGAMASPALKLRNTDIVGKFARHAEMDSWLVRMASKYSAIEK